jgi:hypothetical protein
MYTQTHLPLPYTFHSTYNYLDTLHRDCNKGTPSATRYMEDLWEFNEDCQYEQEEWKADWREEIRNNHNIAYPKRDYLATPRSWDALDKPGNGLPCIIEGSHPLRPALKRHHYQNARTPRYHISQPHPPRVPCPPPEPEIDVIPSTPPPPTTLGDRYHGNNNNTTKPTYHINSCTTPYSTSQLRPPPWPNKHLDGNRDQNRHQQNGKYTPAKTTVGQRPPPRPNIRTSPILSIANSRPPPQPNICRCRHQKYSPISTTTPTRPPPWPIIPHHLNYTLHNHQNAKRRIKRQAKAKSRLLSEHN